MVVATALLLQILLPALASPRLGDGMSRDGAWWSSAAGVAGILCIGRPDLPGAPDLPADGRTDAAHGCCVLCTTPGLSTVTIPVVGPAPAWHRIAAEVPRRYAVAIVPERSPIRPRAPPAA
ncbi:hypothetical protein CCR97_16920 [Rhodoplanes elegans]|uniref:DUF2946 domain-containing protein n=1 Tax=Rhodoplanes elegans TaxID=29408 RepID=A0A327K0C4_9BRAD|nr:hypothetical protein [Rhodoplanes elegans]MBK5959873.1 hypothetical protein [Rhodoplanes elegans]RAI31877.1 hypothetical protein CH338_25120 [Rhodoplanes elegans]